MNCPELATEAISELLYCSKPVEEPISEPLFCSKPAVDEPFVCPVIPVMIPKNVNEHLVCSSSPVTAKEAIFALSTQPITTTETICERSTLFRMATEAVNELCPVKQRGLEK